MNFLVKFSFFSVFVYVSSLTKFEIISNLCFNILLSTIFFFVTDIHLQRVVFTLFTTLHTQFMPNSEEGHKLTETARLYSLITSLSVSECGVSS